MQSLIPNSRYEPSRELSPDDIDPIGNPTLTVIPAPRNADPITLLPRDPPQTIEFVDLNTGECYFKGYHVFIKGEQLVALHLFISQVIAEDLIAQAQLLVGGKLDNAVSTGDD